MTRCSCQRAAPSRGEVHKVKLTELRPRWIHPNLFVFACPHCFHQAPSMFLGCKNAVMGHAEQFELFKKHFGEDWNQMVVPLNPGFAWSIQGVCTPEGFANLSVTPSIDASNSGHWHGFITNGEIR
jgi:hypothetical protein